MYLEFIREDITKLKVDAIVNPSNPYLIPGDLSSVSGQIYQAAGYKQLDEASMMYAPIGWGEAIITSAFDLPCRHIIHVANPFYTDGHHHEVDQLKASYRNAFDLALKHHLKSIAFPLLSAGTYNWPKEKALQIALSEIQSFILNHEMKVYLVVYDKTVFELSQKLSDSIKDYIDEHLEHEVDQIVYYNAINSDELAKRLQNHDCSFSDQLFDIIDAKHLNEVEVYKNANVSKAVFSKIRSNRDYRPSKNTALAFCIALKLNFKESSDLLNKAGLSFSPYTKQDIIVEYFIKMKNYNIMELNLCLYQHDQMLLGSNAQ